MLAGSYAITWRSRPRLRRFLVVRGWMPSARPVAVGTGRLSMCLTFYPHLLMHRGRKRPVGPAPTMTMSYFLCEVVMVTVEDEWQVTEQEGGTSRTLLMTCIYL